MTHIVTHESLNAMLNNPNQEYVQKVIGRALVALLERQTADEQHCNTTKEHNNIGFSGCDGRSGTLTAKYWMKHKRLEQWMVERWTKIGKGGLPRLCRYAKQLNQIAMERSIG